MGKTFITSDLHLSHDKEFIWKERGYNSVEEMNESIVSKWNSVVDKKDDVYVLGDLMLGKKESIEYLKRLNGNIHIIMGNHDTTNRIKEYGKLDNVIEILNGHKLKYTGYTFFLSHYPTLTANYDDEENLKSRVINLCGHTHTTNKFQDMDKGLIYHCEVDAHNCYPVQIETIINDLESFLKRRFLTEEEIELYKRDREKHHLTFEIGISWDDEAYTRKEGRYDSAEEAIEALKRYII